MRQYEILCANDAGRAPRKYPADRDLLSGLDCSVREKRVNKGSYTKNIKHLEIIAQFQTSLPFSQ